MNAKLLAALVGVGLSRMPAQAQHLSAPGNIVYAPNGQLFVANFGTSNVAVFEADGTYVNSFPVSAGAPYRIAWDANGDLFVDAGNDVAVYNSSGQQTRLFRNAFGDALASTAEDGLTSINNGVAQVYDRRGKVIDKYTQDLQGPMFAGGSAAIRGRDLYYVTGPKGGPSMAARYNVDEFVNGSPREERLFRSRGAYNPTQIAVDAAGDIYVVGYANTQGQGGTKMIKLSPHGHVELEIKGLAFPYGVAVDTGGRIYVSEVDANDVKVFDASGALLNTIR